MSHIQIRQSKNICHKGPWETIIVSARSIVLSSSLVCAKVVFCFNCSQSLYLPPFTLYSSVCLSFSILSLPRLFTWTINQPWRLRDWASVQRSKQEFFFFFLIGAGVCCGRMGWWTMHTLCKHTSNAAITKLLPLLKAAALAGSGATVRFRNEVPHPLPSVVSWESHSCLGWCWRCILPATALRHKALA